MTDGKSDTTPANRVAQALEALTGRAFNRCLFPIEVKEACAALDAYGRIAEADAAAADEWNAAIEAVHHLVSEAADGRGEVWTTKDEDYEVSADMVLDRLPPAIWKLRR